MKKITAVLILLAAIASAIYWVKFRQPTGSDSISISEKSKLDTEAAQSNLNQIKVKMATGKISEKDAPDTENLNIEEKLDELGVDLENPTMLQVERAIEALLDEGLIELDRNELEKIKEDRRRIESLPNLEELTKEMHERFEEDNRLLELDLERLPESERENIKKLLKENEANAPGFDNPETNDSQ